MKNKEEIITLWFNMWLEKKDLGIDRIFSKNILSLAVNYHPHDVAFLLIDYKGRRS